MRSIFTTLLFAAIVTVGHAQRPWTRIADPLVGAFPKLAATSSAAYVYDTITAISYDQGLQWNVVTSLEPGCKAIVDFVSNTTLAYSQPVSGGLVHTAYTLTGSSWTKADTLNIGTKHVVAASSAGQTVYIATTEGWVYSWSTSIDSSSLNLGNAELRDFLATESNLLAWCSNGLFMRSGSGEWKLANPPSLKDNLDVTTAIVKYNNDMYAATDLGVYVYSSSQGAWVKHGTWEEVVGQVQVAALAADNARVIAMVKTAANRHQLYRLENTDTVWVVTGYELPLDQPTMQPHTLVIDAGWAITYQQSSVDADSTGLYAYNLNDFTGVNEELDNSSVRIVPSPAGFTVESSDAMLESVDVLSLDGRIVCSTSISSAVHDVALPASARGLLCIIGRTHTGKTFRTIIVR